MITFSFTIARPSMIVKADGTLASGITVLTGSSGSGKSTFIKCIAGLVKPTTGIIRCDERTWVDRDQNIWVPAQERQVGYMPQGNIVFPHLSVEHNITYSKRGTPDMCDSLLKRLGLEKYRNTKAGRLSGGEQQKIAIARAIFADSQIIFADEPTGALDSTSRQIVFDILRTLANQGKCILMVTHDIELASKTDRALILKDGLISQEIIKPKSEELTKALGIETNVRER